MIVQFVCLFVCLSAILMCLTVKVMLLYECVVFESIRQIVRGSGGLVPSCPPP